MEKGRLTAGRERLSAFFGKQQSIDDMDHTIGGGDISSGRRLSIERHAHGEAREMEKGRLTAGRERLSAFFGKQQSVDDMDHTVGGGDVDSGLCLSVERHANGEVEFHGAAEGGQGTFGIEKGRLSIDKSSTEEVHESERTISPNINEENERTDIKGDGEERDSVGMLSTVYDFAVGMIWGDGHKKVQVLCICLPFQAQFQL
jgi:hypothetical protein